MTWIIKQLSGPLGAFIIGVLAAILLAMGSAIIYDRFEIASLKTDVATAQKQTADEHTARIQAESNSRTLSAALDKQSDYVRKVAADCKATSDYAAATTIKAIASSKAAPDIQGSGYKVMNEWASTLS